MKIYPVIHFFNRHVSLNEVKVAKDNGADGVFLISHNGDNDELLNVAYEAKQTHKDFPIGINLLGRTATEASLSALKLDLDMVWADYMGVSSSGLDSEGEFLKLFANEHPNIKLFASIAFKYQAKEKDPVKAAMIAHSAGFIPTTSGEGTGSAPNLAKIRNMYYASGVLGVASGMTPENIGEYSKFLSHTLVATGISLDEYRMDPKKLRQLIINSDPVFRDAWYGALPLGVQLERKSFFAGDIEEELELFCIEEMRNQNV